MTPQRMVRCHSCGRRLLDLLNEILNGQAVLEIKCPKCGHPHVELVRAP